jgi:hypothetical protein
MTHSSLSNFTAIIHTQLEEHTNLAEHLTHLNEVLSFTLNADLCNINPAELHAQLISISKGIREALELNEIMLDRLAGDLIAQALESDEKQSA